MRAGRKDRSSPSARHAAERILAVRDHGVEELRRKLMARGCVASEVEPAIRELLREGLLDDERYARTLTSQAFEKGRGIRYAKGQLASRGVRPSEPPATVEEEAESLRAYLRRRSISPNSLTDRAERTKILRFLAGRGYTSAALSLVFGWTITEADSHSGE
jgi:SOS response regulatory protein OraA/RecX